MLFLYFPFFVISFHVDSVCVHREMQKRKRREKNERAFIQPKIAAEMEEGGS